ncbi:MAG: hypothetical protein CMP65_04325 [Flavobacteriales bacterium]|nr:hypothetical protein [Flavobacteriales bacterium]
MGSRFFWFYSLIFLILFFDQTSKIIVRLNMGVGDHLEVFPWFLIYFVENNGFAFGLELFGYWGKFFLTLFRIVFSFFLFKWLIRVVNVKGVCWGSFSMLLIFSGAIGNIIDSVFYGLVFDYSPLFFGKVVDFLYFPLFEGFYPKWLPIIGGQEFLFFGYIFNIADCSITIGAFILLFVYRDVSFSE